MMKILHERLFLGLVMCSLSVALIEAMSNADDVVFSAQTKIGLLQVFQNDSYVLFMNGEAILQNSTTGVHINGTWWTTTAQNSTSQCSAETDIDYRGSDLYFVNNTMQPATCCELCARDASCRAWTWTGDTSAARDPAWAYRCYIKSSSDGRGPYAGHVSGTPNGAERRLARTSAQAVQGSSATLGAFTAWNITYLAGQTPFVVSFMFYPAHELMVFSQWFPEGATALNITTAINTTHVRLTEFASSSQPATMFPTWTDASGPSAALMGSVTWGGRFAPVSIARSQGMCALLQQAGGAEGGPLVLFNTSASELSSVVVLSPMNNFKGSILGSIAGVHGGACGVAGGLNGYVQNLDAGFSTAFALVLSDNGITGGVWEWGQALQAAHNTTRRPDPVSSLLTYWTDNGAYYDFYAYEPDINSKGLVQDILVALDQTFRNSTYGVPLPVHHFMLDAYWMYNERPNCNCKVNDTAWPLPFPRGLGWLVDQMGGRKLILYNGPQCADTTYAGAWPLVPSLYFDVGWARGSLSMVTGPASYAFYDQLFGRADLPFAAFTQDFLDFHSLLFPAWLAQGDGNAAWMEGQARAADAHGLTVQYCMALPADLMQALALPAVTNARASDDYGAGGSNWKIGATSLLHWALGLRPSKDNFWSTGKATDRGHETSPMLQAVVCALSTGPVGFADALGMTDPSVLWPTMRADGVLLHPGRPATAIDAQFEGRPGWIDLDTRIASTAVPGGPQADLLYYSVLIAGPTSAFAIGQLTASQLWPPPSAGYDYALWQFGNAACTTPGASAAQCLAPLSGTAKVNTTAGGPALGSVLPDSDLPGCRRCAQDLVRWGLWTAVPTVNGVTLLGEAVKYVAVSQQRVVALVPVSGGLDLTLVGAPSELVVMWYVVGGTVASSTAMLDAGGEGHMALRA